MTTAGIYFALTAGGSFLIAYLLRWGLGNALLVGIGMGVVFGTATAPDDIALFDPFPRVLLGALGGSLAAMAAERARRAASDSRSGPSSSTGTAPTEH